MSSPGGARLVFTASCDSASSTASALSLSASISINVARASRNCCSVRSV